MPSGDDHRRPDGIDDGAVEAVGKLGEALETLERARGRLYDFHQLMGHADLMLDEAARMFDEAGLGETAERLRCEVIGRNVIAGRWTFQVVEDFDDGYYAAFREVERDAREQHTKGIRHLFEAEMKERRRTHGRPGHESRPGSA